MNIKRFTVHKGFTIVETLVAITILMIAVTGPLVASSRGINAALYSRDQMVATFLAQESMEVLKSTRSNNLDTWIGTFSACLGEDSYCDVGALDSFSLETSCPTGGCPLTLGNLGYDRSGGAVDTKVYRRYFYFEDMNPGSSDPKEMRAHVVVSWDQGRIPYQMELVSEMINTRI